LTDIGTPGFDRCAFRGCGRFVEATMISRLKTWARGVTRDGHAIYLASRDPRVPWYVKALAIAIAAYALSPIDLIPDFIPVLGYLDDLILLPLGIRLVVALIPDEVMAEYRIKADDAARRPVSKAGMLAIVMLWLIGAAALGWAGYALWQRRLRT
jgi:uncharacterized membrane protein YkvA (DUF1232 family)